MSELHDRLEKHGRQGALAFTDTLTDRQALEAAVSFMSAEDQKIGFLFSGWCQTALPHKKRMDDEIWSVATDHVKLMIEPGSIQATDGTASRVGVPYGSRARLILLFLQSEAIRTNSREIQLGRSLRVWLGKLNVPIGGKSMAEIREQALRISRCRMSFQIVNGDKTGFINQNLVDTAMFARVSEGSLLETVKLSEVFFEQLKRHPVPLQESAIRAISNNSQALDVYCWLAYRLHSLTSDCDITWKALHAQFGAAYKSLQNFRPRFVASLQVALAVYPDAKVMVSKRGIRLSPGNAPVPRRQLALETAPQAKLCKSPRLKAARSTS